MSGYPRKPLGAVLTRVQESVAIEPQQTYKQVTVRLFHKGVVLRGEKQGSAIRTTRQWLVRSGQVLLSRIDARNGAIGIVPLKLENAVVTNDFWAFDVNPAVAVPQFLDAYFGTREFVDACNAASEGTTNRVRLQPERFLRVDVPLPPIDEQRRIVARIDDLAIKVGESHRLKKEALEAAHGLVKAKAEACFRSLKFSYGTKAFSTLKPHITSGPRNWGKYYADSGLRFYRAQDIGADFRITGASKVYVERPANGEGVGARLRPGDLMLVITGATVGRCTVFCYESELGLVNQHVALCRFPIGSVVPEYVLWGLRSTSGQEQLLQQRYGQGKPGLNLDNIKALELPFPSLEEQRRTVAFLDDLQAQVDSLKELQSETAAELDALMPSILSKAFRGEL